jgi:hypothetical protein
MSKRKREDTDEDASRALMEKFEEHLDKLTAKHFPQSVKRFKPDEKIKLATDERGQQMRELLKDHVPDVLATIMLQYARGESECSRDKLDCTTCGFECVDCEEPLICKPMWEAMCNFDDCPICGLEGPRCGECQSEHLGECIGD